MPQVDVNFWALVVCAAASMVTGFLWYGPLFSRAWMKSVGMDPAIQNDPVKMKEMQSKAGPGYVAMFIGAGISAYVLTHILDYAEAGTIGDGLATAFWVWLGFVATTTALGAKFFEKKGWDYYWINTGYYLVNLLIFAAILVSWR